MLRRPDAVVGGREGGGEVKTGPAKIEKREPLDCRHDMKWGASHVTFLAPSSGTVDVRDVGGRVALQFGNLTIQFADRGVFNKFLWDLQGRVSSE
jgi:hypothetical protein